MSIVLLSRKPLDARPLHEWLRDAGAPLCLVTTRSAWAAAPRGSDEAFCEVVTVDDYLSWEVELQAEDLARRHSATLIASSSEDDVIRAARVRERLALPGQSSTSAWAYRDKITMKCHAASSGVRVPTNAAVDTPLDLTSFVAEHGFPAVLKPRRGAGSVGVHILRDDRDVHEVLAAGILPASPSRAGSWMVEAHVSARFFHVDGIAAGGRVLHCWPSEYSSGNATATSERIPLSSVLLDAASPQRPILQRHAADVVAALPATPFPTSFHLEAWVPDDGIPILCEIASRTGGASVADVYAAAFGVRLPRESLRGQCGLPPALARQPEEPSAALGWIALTPGEGTFAPPPEPCPVPGVRMTYRTGDGESGPAVVHAGDSVASVVVEADCEAEVRSRIARVVAWWEASNPWR